MLIRDCARIVMVSVVLLHSAAIAASESNGGGCSEKPQTVIIRIAVVDADSWEPVPGATVRLCEDGPAPDGRSAVSPVAKTNEAGLAVFAFDGSASEEGYRGPPAGQSINNSDSWLGPIDAIDLVGSAGITHPAYSSRELRLCRHSQSQIQPTPTDLPCERLSYYRPDEIWAMALAGCNVRLQVGARYLDLALIAGNSINATDLPGGRALPCETSFAATLEGNTRLPDAAPQTAHGWRIDFYEIPLQPKSHQKGPVPVLVRLVGNVSNSTVGALVSGAAGSNSSDPSAPQLSISLAAPSQGLADVDLRLEDARRSQLGVAVIKLTPEKAAQLWNLPEPMANAVSYGSLMVDAVAPGSPAAQAGIEPGYVFFSMSSTDSGSAGTLSKAQTFFQSESEYTQSVAQRSFKSDDEVVFWGFQFPQGYQCTDTDDLGRYRKRYTLQFESMSGDPEPQRAGNPSAAGSRPVAEAANPGSASPTMSLPSNARSQPGAAVPDRASVGALFPSLGASANGTPRRANSSSLGSSKNRATSRATPRHTPGSITKTSPLPSGGSTASGGPTVSATVPAIEPTARSQGQTYTPPAFSISGTEKRDFSDSGRASLSDFLSSPFQERPSSGTGPAEPNRNSDSWTDEEFAQRPIVDLGAVEMEFVLIPRGEFTRGSPETEQGRDNDEGPVQTIRIAKPFWMSKYEVTQEQYTAVMGRNPSSFKANDNPVDSVSWETAREFCRRLSRRYDRTFRLPTEAEWEHACRAGTQGRYSYGDDSDLAKLDEYAWYFNNSQGKTHPVGQKNPNGYGLYDMHGNVLEWCLDRYDARYYEVSPTTSPAGPAYGARYVVRGGSWNSSWKNCRSAARHAYEPRFQNYRIGLRIILEME